MRCPNCGSENHKRPSGSKRGLVRDVDGLTFRQHQCMECRHYFTSVQTAVDRELADRFLDAEEDDVRPRT